MIKLYEIETLKDGTKRLQSQLYLFSDTADFIQLPNGKVKIYDFRKGKGFNYYDYNKPFKIIKRSKFKKQFKNDTKRIITGQRV